MSSGQFRDQKTYHKQDGVLEQAWLEFDVVEIDLLEVVQPSAVVFRLDGDAPVSHITAESSKIL